MSLLETNRPFTRLEQKKLGVAGQHLQEPLPPARQESADRCRLKRKRSLTQGADELNFRTLRSRTVTHAPPALVPSRTRRIHFTSTTPCASPPLTRRTSQSFRTREGATPRRRTMTAVKARRGGKSKSGAGTKKRVSKSSVVRADASTWPEALFDGELSPPSSSPELQRHASPVSEIRSPEPGTAVTATRSANVGKQSLAACGTAGQPATAAGARANLENGGWGDLCSLTPVSERPCGQEGDLSPTKPLTAPPEPTATETAGKSRIKLCDDSPLVNPVPPAMSDKLGVSHLDSTCGAPPGRARGCENTQPSGRCANGALRPFWKRNPTLTTCMPRSASSLAGPSSSLAVTGTPTTPYLSRASAGFGKQDPDTIANLVSICSGDMPLSGYLEWIGQKLAQNLDTMITRYRGTNPLRLQNLLNWGSSSPPKRSLEHMQELNDTQVLTHTRASTVSRVPNDTSVSHRLNDRSRPLDAAGIDLAPSLSTPTAFFTSVLPLISPDSSPDRS